MKTFNKLFVGLLLVFGLIAVKSASATGVAVSPKDTQCFAYSTAVSTVAIGPGVLYEVTLSSGAASEYVLTLDSASAVGFTATTAAANPGSITGRLLYASTTANTQIRFDPPLAFFNGFMVVDSSTAGSACYTYEVGRGISGQ